MANSVLAAVSNRFAPSPASLLPGGQQFLLLMPTRVRQTKVAGATFEGPDQDANQFLKARKALPSAAFSLQKLLMVASRKGNPADVLTPRTFSKNVPQRVRLRRKT
jgi:hypothetical protein